MYMIMKKILTFAAVCLMALSCSDKCVIAGTFSDENVPEESVMAIVTDIQTKEADTCAISGGKFTYECPASDTTLLFIRIAGKDESVKVDHHRNVRVIPTKGKIDVDLNADPCTVSGSKLNDVFTQYQKDVSDCYEKYEEQMKEVASLYAEDSPEYEEKQEEIANEVEDAVNQISHQVLSENADNIVGLQAFTSLMYDMDLEEFDQTLQGTSDFIRNNRRVTPVHDAKVKEQETAEGRMFVDFEGKTPEGEVARLSDFVGRGKYVLVDFWASWCGPCKAEIPNIKKLFEQYTDKGLVVLGVAVWDKDNSGSRKVMESLDMKWSQIFVGEDTTPTDVYGILGIPHIILFAPDGTIAKRDLRGSDMIKTVSELFE